MKAVLAVDIGTSSAKALLLSESKEILAEADQSYPTFTPKATWIEQNPEDWWQALRESVRKCLAQGNKVDIAAVGISGHMSVFLPLDQNRQPLRPAITIADTRCVEVTKWLNQNFAPEISGATGNLALTAFTLPKILWFKQHEKALFGKTRTMLTVKDYINYKLTGVLSTEPTDAGNTLLLESTTRQWNTGLMEKLELPQHLFPRLHESLEVIGDVTKEAANALGIKPGLPVMAGLADMGSSTLGAGLLDKNRLAITLGTAGQITQMVDEPSPELLGKCTYHPHALPGKTYLMASLFTGGLGLQWFAEVLSSFTGEGREQSIEKILEVAETASLGSGGVLFLPFLTGRGSPWFDATLTASFRNLRRERTGAEMARAVLEGVTFSIRHCLDLMQKHHAAPKEIVLGGGGSRSKLWSQIIVDVIGHPLHLLKTSGAGPLGTALAAGVAVQLFDMTSPDVSQTIEPMVEHKKVYELAYQAYLRELRGGER
jgi:xylulokinase